MTRVEQVRQIKQRADEIKKLPLLKKAAAAEQTIDEVINLLMCLADDVDNIKIIIASEP